MRSSSIKSLTIVTTLTATLILAVPTADAKPTASREGSRSAITTIKQMIARYLGIQSTGLPGDPIPAAPPVKPSDSSDPLGAPKGTVRR